MMTGLRHLLEALLNPLCLFLIAYTLLLIRLWRQGDPINRIGFSLLYLVLLVISTGWLPKTLTACLEQQYPVVKQADPRVRWVVVLSGGQAEEAGQPEHLLLYNASIKRLLEGLRLYRQLPDATLLLSGGGFGSERAESERMAQLADWFNKPLKPVVLETISLNTAQQAKAIKRWVHNQPFYLVTSAIHMPRAMALCRRQGLNPIAAPADRTLYWQDERWEKRYIPNPQNMVYLTIALHEWLGMAWASLRGDMA
ncbi:YdcF family protein [Legionella sp. MW5194]|uniref:YdcF family protein n=1 Tax=Legionella sp. MW5194 TaxID=2662448 RepID=UPI001EF1230D|nr:ElyC/SanA/YdcF family protein [Legionella sp. MW5194]